MKSAFRFLSVLLIIGLIVPAGALAAKEIKIGAIYPLTGGAAAAVFYAVGFGVVQFSLGEASPGIWTLVWNTLLSAVYGALLAAPAFRLARWALLPTLGRDDPMFRRRRATIASQSVLASPTIDQRSRRRRVRRGR